jgi:hypothetical protein
MTDYKPRGASSATIYNYFNTGLCSGRIPLDYEDFGRCYELLQHYPQWYGRMTEMKNVSKEWDRIGNNWDTLTNLYKHYLSEKDVNSIRQINILLNNFRHCKDEDWIFI